MPTYPQTPVEPHLPPTSSGMLWTGRVLSYLLASLLAFDGVMKITKSAMMVDTLGKLGYAETVVMPIGVTLLVCSLLYMIPQTAILGAILLTGYLGGACASHVRAGQGPAEIMIPVVVGMVLWLGLYLRDARLRALVPLRG